MRKRLRLKRKYKNILITLLYVLIAAVFAVLVTLYIKSLADKMDACDHEYGYCSINRLVTYKEEK